MRSDRHSHCRARGGGSSGRRFVRSGFTPTWIGEVELREPLADRTVPRLCDGARYPQARLLVRLDGTPLGTIHIHLADGILPAEQVRRAVQQRFPHAADRARPRREGSTDASLARAPGTDTSVVVCTRERPESLRATLDSILRMNPSPLEVLVVDNAPRTDCTRTLIAQYRDPRLRYVLEPVPGLSRARNCALAQACGEIIAFTDDDVTVDEAWLDAIGRGFARDPEIACVTGLVAPAELDTPAQAMFDAKVAWGTNYTQRVWDLHTPPADDPLFPYTSGKFGAGANFALRRRWVGALGRFDEALGAGTPSGGGEDLDMFLRVLLRGLKLDYEPAALVWHRHRRDAADLSAQMFSYSSGLAAYACKQLLHPQTCVDALRCVPRAVRRAGTLARADGAPSGGDHSEVRAALLGYAAGPLLYLRGRWSVARRDKRASR